MSGYTIGEIVVWLVLAAAAGFVLGWLVRELGVRAARRRAPDVAEVAAVAAAAAVVAVEHAEAEPTHLEPVVVEPVAEPETADGAPTPEHVVKGKTRSRIYHPPGSPAYARTKADVWFRSVEEAEEAGFRKPRNAGG